MRIILPILMSVILLFSQSAEREQPYHSRDWSGDESRILAQLAMCETSMCDVESKILIINIAINRVWNEEYPDTIEGVVAEMTNGRYIYAEPDYDCWDAEKHVQIDGWDGSKGATEYKVENDTIIPIK